MVGWLVGALHPVKPQKLISGLRETFIERNIVEKSNKAGLRQKEHREKAESCRENFLMKYS